MINAHLKLDGTTEDAFNFYKDALGGEFTTLAHFSETPHAEHLPEEDRSKIMHIILTTSHGTISGSDHLEAMGGPFKKGNDFSLVVQADSNEEADRLFAALSDGGTVTMPIQDVFWGAYFGMFTDKFGVQWMVNRQNM